MGETINVRIRVEGGARANSDLNRVNRQLGQVDQTARILRTTLGALAGAFATGQLLGLVDTFQNLENRLRTVTSSTAELTVVQDALFASANRTRQSYEDVVELFARTTPVFRDLGRSQQELLQFTELFNQSVAASGASAEEASNATRQFLQGLGTNRFQGEELTSVLEQLPTVADIIAREFGVARGELRELGSSGQITADRIVAAFFNARNDIETTFAELTPTIGQQLVVLRNNAVQFFGEFAQSSGLVQGFGQVIGFLANNLELVTRLILTLAQTIITILVGQALARGTVAIVAFATRGSAAIATFVATSSAALGRLAVQLASGQVITAFRTLIAGLSSTAFLNPLIAGFTALFAIIAGGIAILTQFSNQLLISTRGPATLADFLTVAWERFTNLLQTALLPVFRALGSEADSFGQAFTEAFLGIVDIAARTVDAVIALFGQIGPRIANAAIGIQRGFATVLNPVGDFINRLTGTQIEPIQISEFFDVDPRGITEVVREAFSGGGPVANELLAIESQAQIRAVQRQLAQQEDERQREAARNALGVAPERRTLTAGQQVARDQSNNFRQGLADLRQEAELLTFSNGLLQNRNELLALAEQTGRALTTAEVDRATPLIQEVQVLQQQASILNDLRGPEEERMVRQRALNELLQSNLITQQEYNFAIQENVGPLQSNLDALDREISLLQLSEDAYARENDILAIQSELRRELTPLERESISTRLESIQSLQRQNELYSQIVGPQMEFEQSTSDLGALLDSGRISAEQYANAIDQVRLNYLETQTTAAAGFEAGLIRVREQFTDLSGLASDTLVNAFQGAEDALVQFVTTGQLSFSGLIDSITADLARLAIRQSITAPLAGAIGGIFGGGGGLFGSLFGGLFGGGGGGFSGAEAGLLDFQSGGSFFIGNGRRMFPGADSQLVAFRGQPGERVDVIPRDEARGSSGGGIQINYNIVTNDADSFERSQQKIMARTSAGIQRAQRRLNQ